MAIHTPLRQCFDYLPPLNCQIEQLVPGMRLRVPFGKKEVIGVLLAVDQHPQIAIDKLKYAIEIVDEKILFTPKLLSLMQWASQYYQHPIGEVILGAMPKRLRQGQVVTLEIKPASPPLTLNTVDFHLNAHQQNAIEQITSSTGFSTFLLEGVTGSGKTEVYLQTIADKLRAGQQALILVPEIGLTPQTISRFQQRFNVPIIALHSGLRDLERQKAWLEALQGHARIIIGTRSAIFIPLANPGILILDEEHDVSFKQQSGFRYSARDLAIIRGRLENIPVVLGSATPSLETLINAQKQRYVHLSLPQRVGKAIQPKFHMIDIRNQFLEEGLSPALLETIKQHLSQQAQVLLFLNRRGYAPVLLCHSCGWSAACRRCDARLTMHHSPSRLVCHHCGSTQAVFTQCQHCQKSPLIALGIGTERLEQALKKYFPDTELIRIDRDTTRRKGALQKILNRIQNGESQILIGTQMLAKGHHFPNVTLVAIIDTDNGLYSADFRASERMGQLIIQVAGRAGRAEKPGQVYLQTHAPSHPHLQILTRAGYPEFIKQLSQERQNSTWPPFSHLALLRAESTNASAPLNFLEQVKKLAEPLQKDVSALGPIPAPMERKAGRYRAHLLLQAKQRQKLQACLPELIKQLQTLKLRAKVRWSIDVDPAELD